MGHWVKHAGQVFGTDEIVEVHRLYERGMPKADIARLFGVQSKTIKRYLILGVPAERPIPPSKRPGYPRRSKGSTWRKEIKVGPRERWCRRVMKGMSKRACKKGYPMTVKIQDLREILVDRCPFTGRLLEYEHVLGDTSPKRGDYASVDKIDPGRGYTPGNIRVISFWANVARSNLPDEEFMGLCSAVSGLRNS